MMDYFKKNPSALMDAIPTPPNEEADEGEAALKQQPQRLLEFNHAGEVNQI